MRALWVLWTDAEICCGQAALPRQRWQKKNGRRRSRKEEKDGAGRDILYALSLHMSLLLNLPGIHGCLSEEQHCFVLFMCWLKSPLLTWVSPNKKKKESFFYCELWTLFVNPWADDQVQSRKKVFFTSSLNCQRFRSLVENVNTLKYHDTFDSRYLISILQHCILFLINN